MNRFEGKVILLAGAGGISNETSKRLATEGAKLVIGDINPDAAQSAAENLTRDGHIALGLPLDLSEEESVKAFIERGASAFGGVDGLFNVAADISRDTAGRDSDVVDVPVEVWNRTLLVDLTGYFLTIRHIIPHLLKRGGGAIVNTTSAAAYGGQTHLAAYGVAKAGVAALTHHVANRWGRDGIRCNSVAPGFILTGVAKNWIAEIFAEDKFDYDKVWTGMATRRGGPPSPRLGAPSDIAATVAFLLSYDAGYINGQSVGVDGGIMFR
jgi:NAD(P)-dependent dehydrogenase (short-subunit alcohol dehydrogenase family)